MELCLHCGFYHDDEENAAMEAAAPLEQNEPQPTELSVSFDLSPQGLFGFLSYLRFSTGDAVHSVVHIAGLITELQRTMQEELRREQERIQRRTIRVMAALPQVEFFRRSINEPNCMICLEEFADGDKLTELPCGHHFHSADCIGTWLTEKPVCPLCNGSIGKTPTEMRKLFKRRQNQQNPTSISAPLPLNPPSAQPSPNSVHDVPLTRLRASQKRKQPDTEERVPLMSRSKNAKTS